MGETGSKFPAILQVGQDGAVQEELRIDNPILSTQAERFRDRDEEIACGLLDGAGGPTIFSTITLDNLVVEGTLSFGPVGTINIPEITLIWSNI